MKRSLATALIILFSCIATVLVVHAQSYTPLAPLPIGEGGATPSSYTMSTYLSGALKLLIALGGAFSILTAIIGGTQYVAASITPDAKNNAKKRIENAFIGLALVLTSYLILNSINPKLLAFNFMLPAVGDATGLNNPEQPITPPPPPPASTLRIIATAGANGTITPDGITTVARGGSQVYTISPNNGFVIAALTVDGVPMTTLTTYSFTNVVAAHTIDVTFTTLPAGNVVNPNAPSLDAPFDQNNDYSIITHCLTVPTYNLCPRADFNNDGITDSADFTLFVERGARLDLNGDKKIISNPASTPTSCYLKISSANVRSLIPGIDGDGNSVCGGGGFSSPPTVSCGGSDGWLKFSKLGSTCPIGSGLLNMPFGFVYGAASNRSSYYSAIDGGIDGQYSNFRNWIIDASSGVTVNLAALFQKTFLNKPQPCVDCVWDPYLESNLGKITYATIAQYDLNNDGTSDFSAGGADMTAFNACKGVAISGACAQADFNGDGVIDDHDLVLRDLIVKDIYSQPTNQLMGSYTNTTTGIMTSIFLQSFSFTPYHWLLEQFESMFFDTTRYTDKQVAKYCVGHKPFEKCAAADVDGSCRAQYLSCGTDMTCRAQFEACAVGADDVTKFDVGAAQLDLNGDGKVDLQ